MDGLTPNLTHGIRAKDILPPVEKSVMQLVQQWGVGKLTQGLPAKICGADYACFQISKTACITTSTLVELCIGMLGHVNEDLLWVVLVCGSHGDGNKGRLRV
jgi:hypothetical protein